MKKLVYVFAMVSLFAFAAPQIVRADYPDCPTMIAQCADGSQHYVVVCDDMDEEAWLEILC